MRTRYSLDADGMLVNRDGDPLGRVVSITIDDSLPATPVRVGDRVSRSLPSKTSTAEGIDVDKGRVVGKPNRPTATQLEREAVQRVWAYWLEVSAKKQTLDSKRARIIARALHTAQDMNDCSADVAEQLVKRALLGLTRSPHHRGENEQHRSYMEVRYALKGRGDESDDERIEKAITWAALYAPETTEITPEKAERYLDDVRYTLSRPHQPERQRAVEAWRKLREAGFTVQKLSGPPWARLTR